MKSLKHSKLKNTGILFELLVRQLASDTMNNVDSKAMPIIKKYFSKNTELFKEYTLYQTLIKEKFSKEEKANYLIDAVLKSRESINKSVLNRQKYNLIKEINSNYNLENFFKAKVDNYKALAAIYKLFEYKVEENPSENVSNRYTIVEHITNKKVKRLTENSDISEFAKQDKDVRLLSYKILVDKFNDKYSDLNEGQKRLLKNYINSVTNGPELKTYVKEQVASIGKEITRLLPKVQDKVVSIKLQEVKNLLKNIGQVKSINETHILNLLRYQELIKELKQLK